MARHEHEFAGSNTLFFGGSQFDIQNGYPGYELYLSVGQASQSSEWGSQEEEGMRADDLPIAKLQFTITDNDDYESSTLLNLVEIDELILVLIAFKKFCAERSVPSGKDRLL